MKEIEITGRNVNEAIQNSLDELNVSEDEIEVEVLDKGSKGLFNRIGAKPAKIKVTLKRDYVYETKLFIQKVLDIMNIEAEINVIDDGDVLKVNLTGSDMGILIGYRGETLDAFQYLLSLIINKENEGSYKKVIVDIENYRAKREETLTKLAIRMADKVKTSGRYVKLEPMNPYERRIIHSALQNDLEVKTYSEGEDPYRRVVIDVKRA